jgi:transposase
MEIDIIGIDLGKTVFHLVGLNARGEVVVRRKFSRTQLLRFTANHTSGWPSAFLFSPGTCSRQLGTLGRCLARSCCVPRLC